MPWAMQSQEGSMQLQQFSESRAPSVCCDPAAKAKQPLDPGMCELSTISEGQS